MQSIRDQKSSLKIENLKTVQTVKFIIIRTGPGKRQSAQIMEIFEGIQRKRQHKSAQIIEVYWDILYGGFSEN